MKPIEEIVNLWMTRRNTRSRAINQMERVRDAYNADLVLPYSERLGQSSVTPNLVMSGVDQLAMRMTSTTANIRCPSTRPGRPRADKAARDRRLALYGWWEANDIEIKDRRRARWYVAYSCMPSIIRPCPELAGPRWHLRDPLSAFPGDCEDPDDTEPPDAIFPFRRTHAWLRRYYPDAWMGLEKRSNASPDDTCTLLEYCDGDEISLIVVSENGGPTPTDSWPATPTAGWQGGERWIALERIVNRTGICPAVVAGRVNLDRRRSPFEDAVGMSVAQALLVGVELEAVMDGVWPNEWLIASQPGVSPKIVKMANGREGEIGIVEGGDIKAMTTQPGYLTNPTRDWLERNQRVTAGISPEFGGEAGTNVRTGRRADQILSAVVEFPIQEGQAILARAKEAENRRAIAVLKAYFGNQPKSFYVSWKGARGQVDYVPNDIFDTDRNKVTYPMAGADVNNLTIAVGQLAGVGMLSTRTAMEMHPYIDDAEEELDRIQAESIRRAGFAAIQAMAEGGQIPPGDIARIAQLIESNQLEWWDAVAKVQREAQERQSSTVDPAEPGSPEAQAGLALPGTGAESGGAIPPPLSGQQAIAAQLNSMYPVQAALGR